MKSSHWVRVALFSVLMGAFGCDDAPAESDAGPGDAGLVADGGPQHDGGPERDGGPLPDGGEADGGPDAGGELDAGSEDAGTDATLPPGDAGADAGPIGGGAATSAQIEAVRLAADGTLDPALPVDDAIVTYVKPATGDDPAGFFVQAETLGPALFVMRDPALTPAPAVGDVVSFPITEMTTNQGRREVVAIAGLTIESSGNDTSFLVQDVSSGTDLISAIGDYEHEHITIAGTLAGPFAFSGLGHVAAPLDTTGIRADPNLLFRIPETLRDSEHLIEGCAITATGVMWRFSSATLTRAQPSIYFDTDLAASCPAPSVLAAVTMNEITAVVTLSADIDPASVLADASQITITDAAANPLAVSAVSVVGSTLVLTTAAQVRGTTYTVTVAGTVLDFYGSGVSASANSATFVGYRPHLVINEIDYDQTGADPAEFIEIANPGIDPISLTGVIVHVVNGSGVVSYANFDLTSLSSLAGGAYLLIGAVPGAAFSFAGPNILQNGTGTAGQPGDGIVILAADGSCHDAVAYADRSATFATGTFMGCTFEGNAGTDTTTTSIGRIPNMVDTGDSVADFERITPSPGAANTL